MMPEGKVICRIEVLDNGDFRVTNTEGQILKPLDPEELGKSLSGKTISAATIMPPISIIKSNPCWVCIGGRWYYI